MFRPKLIRRLSSRHSLTENRGGKCVERSAESHRFATGLAAHVSYLIGRVQHDKPLAFGLDLGRYQAQAFGRGVIQSLQVHAVHDERRFCVRFLFGEFHDFPVQVIDGREIEPVVGRYQQEFHAFGL